MRLSSNYILQAYQQVSRDEGLRDLRFWVWGFRVSGLGFGGLEFRVRGWGLGFGGLGFRVWGFGV